MQTDIKEIFESIQGEGLYAGDKQIFVRFTRCNLGCRYCDTDFRPDDNGRMLNEQELFDIVRKYDSGTIAFTGGEPLLDAYFISSFLKKYKKLLNKKVFLETNGTRVGELLEVLEYVDVISADIKIKSATGEENNFDINDTFLEAAKDKKTYIKVVFDKYIEDYEIKSVTEIAKKHNLIIVLQPKMPFDESLDLTGIYNKFYGQYKKIKLLPQMHKFLKLR